MAGLPEQQVTFACQECGKSITFPADSAGHVEVCPECGSYVDVPRKSEMPSPAETKVGPRKNLDPTARTTAQLWFEVSAVLCLAYVPWMFGTLVAAFTERETGLSFVDDRLYMIVDAIRVSMPLLVIMALTRDRWSQFGIVRPKWITDAIVGCVICFCGILFDDFVISLLPVSILRMPRPPHVAHRIAPEGIPEYFLLLTSCIASGFAQELIFRGYLIPRFERLLRSTWIAVLVTTVLFASFHVYQGTVSVIGIAAMGLIYAIAFCLLRRLWPLCVAHALSIIVYYLHLIR